MHNTKKTRNPVGWGYVEDALPQAEVDRTLQGFAGMFDISAAQHRPPPQPAQVELPPARIEEIPGSLRAVVHSDHATRLLCAAGRSYRDIVALRKNQLHAAPDCVARPSDRDQIYEVLAWAERNHYAVIPFGGGSSVVGGVTPEVPAGYNGVVTLDLREMNRVLDVDERDRVVHVEAGVFGPELEAALKPYDLAARHFPQSYFHSTVGGWVATRGAGHFSTLHAKIEDRVQSVGLISPSGLAYETRPLPASSVAVDPNRLVAGSEGMLGVITDVRLRVVPVPHQRADASVSFSSFEAALEAGRLIVQAGLWPTQMRILDPFEHMVSALIAGKPPVMQAYMILSFESVSGPVDTLLQHALALAGSCGGKTVTAEAPRDGGSETWKNSFFRQPYLRDAMIDYGAIVDTFETAVPWHRIPDFYHDVREATLAAVNRVCGGGAVLCRVTHAYPDGVALYFSFYALGQHAALQEQWQEIKQAAGDAVERGGGTASHHHAMGRDHRQWGEKELPPGFRAAYAGAKAVLDPGGIMNPGVWWDDPGRKS